DRVHDGQVDVDQRLRGQTADGGRADVVEPAHLVAERLADPEGSALEPVRPDRVVVGDDDLAVLRRRALDGKALHVVVRVPAAHRAKTRTFTQPGRWKRRGRGPAPRLAAPLEEGVRPCRTNRTQLR